jgi:hypothetical protein
LKIPDLSTQEAREFLTDAQYSHVAQQFRQLCREAEPTTSDLVDVRPIDDFHEMRDKGGPLGRINVRVFVLRPPRAAKPRRPRGHQQEEQRPDPAGRRATDGAPQAA